MGTRTLPKVLRTTLDIGGRGRPWKMFNIRPGLIALAALLLAPALASAQPTLYVCSPSGKSFKSTERQGTRRSSQPERRLSMIVYWVPMAGWYIANDLHIARVNLASPGSAPVFVNSVPLGSAARGLAFNVTTLYINTVTSGVLKLVGTDPNNGLPLDFSNAVQAVNVSTAGQGLVFDNAGNMYVASNSTILLSAPPASGDTPYGGATEKLSDKPPLGSPSIRATSPCSPIPRAGWSSESRPTGTVYILWFSSRPRRVKASCRTFRSISKLTPPIRTLSLQRIRWVRIPRPGARILILRRTIAPVAVRVRRDSRNWTRNSVGTRQLWEIAVAATNYSLTKTFDATHCSNQYDFGYHRLTYEFTDCATTFATRPITTITVTALKSKLSDVTFSGSEFDNLPKPIEGMRYSPMGGHPIQYQVIADPPVGPQEVAPINVIYHFFTQETVWHRVSGAHLMMRRLIHLLRTSAPTIGRQANSIRRPENAETPAARSTSSTTRARSDRTVHVRIRPAVQIRKSTVQSGRRRSLSQGRPRSQECGSIAMEG